MFFVFGSLLTLQGLSAELIEVLKYLLHGSPVPLYRASASNQVREKVDGRSLMTQCEGVPSKLRVRWTISGYKDRPQIRS